MRSSDSGPVTRASTRALAAASQASSIRPNITSAKSQAAASTQAATIAPTAPATPATSSRAAPVNASQCRRANGTSAATHVSPNAALGFDPPCQHPRGGRRPPSIRAECRALPPRQGAASERTRLRARPRLRTPEARRAARRVRGPSSRLEGSRARCGRPGEPGRRQSQRHGYERRRPGGCCKSDGVDEDVSRAKCPDACRAEGQQRRARPWPPSPAAPARRPATTRPRTSTSRRVCPSSRSRRCAPGAQRQLRHGRHGDGAPMAVRQYSQRLGVVNDASRRRPRSSRARHVARRERVVAGPLERNRGDVAPLSHRSSERRPGLVLMARRHPPSRHACVGNRATWVVRRAMCHGPHR